MKPNDNYTESDDGYWKNDKSVQRGNADYFARPIPPVRDSANRPLIPDGDERIDTARWIKEINDAQ